MLYNLKRHIVDHDKNTIELESNQFPDENQKDI